MKISCSLYTLTCLSFTFGFLAGVSLSLAVSTDAWLYMKEPLILPLEILKAMNLTEQLHIVTHIRSGFWRVCTTNIANGTQPDECLPVDYTQQGSGRQSGAPTSMSIVGATRISAPLVVAALVVCLASVLFHVTGAIQADYKTLVAGVLYILSGLILAVGIILFISAINDEVGYRNTKNHDGLKFSYSYGWSFFIAGISFVAAELAAVVCVTIFLRRYSKMSDMLRIIPGLEEKLGHDYEQIDRYGRHTDSDQAVLYMG